MRRLNERTIFLLDGTGGLLSAMVNGLALPAVSAWIGLPTWILQALGLMGLSFAGCSLGCYWLLRRTKASLLLAIVVANLLYCVLTSAILFAFDGITSWGRACLSVEILVVLAITALEVRELRKLQ